MRTRLRAGEKRGAGCVPTSRPCRSRPGTASTAAVRRTADPDFLARRRHRRKSAATSRCCCRRTRRNTSRQRILAFGPAAADPPCGWIVGRRRCGRRRGLLLNLTASNDARSRRGPRHRRPGHCAHPRNSADCARYWLKTNLRPQGAARRDRDAARLRRRGAVADLEPGAANGGLSYVNAAYARATEAASVAEPSHPRPRIARQRRPRQMERTCRTRAGFAARLPIVSAASGASTMCATGSAAAAPASRSSQRSHGAQCGHWCGWLRAHRRTLDQLSSGVAVFDDRRRLAFYNDPMPAVGSRSRASSTQSDDSSVLTGCAPRASCPTAGFSCLESKLHEAYRAVEPKGQPGISADGRAVRVVTRLNPEARSLSVRRRHREPRAGAAVRRPDPGQRENPRQPREAVRGVRQQRPRAIVQPGLRQDGGTVAEAMSGRRISKPWKPGSGRCSDDAVTWRTIREAITTIEKPRRCAAETGAKDGSVLDCMTRRCRTALPC